MARTRKEEIIHLYKRICNEIDEDIAGEVIVNVISNNSKIYPSTFANARRKYKHQIQNELINKERCIDINNLKYTYDPEKVFIKELIYSVLEEYIQKKLPKKKKLSNLDIKYIEMQNRDLEMFYKYFDDNLTLVEIAKIYNLSSERVRQIVNEKIRYVKYLKSHDIRLKSLFKREK